MFYLESYYNALTTPEIRIKIKLFGYICIRQNNIVIIRTVILRTKNTGGFEYASEIPERIARESAVIEWNEDKVYMETNI